jgi:hypothetical protein
MNIDLYSADGDYIETANVNDALWKAYEPQFQVFAQARGMSLHANGYDSVSRNVSTFGEFEAWVSDQAQWSSD